MNVGGSGPDNYSKIQNAIKDSNDGDTVFVWNDSSPYYEHVLINKRIRLIGEDKYSTVIDGCNNGDVVTVMVDGVYLSGFTIRNSGNDWIDAGVKLNSDNNIVIGNIFLNNNFGLYSYNLDNSIICDNIINNSFDSGIHLPFSNNITISNNTITNNRLKGIFLYDSNVHCTKRNLISKNTISNNKEGVYFWFSYRTNISGNMISNNTVGISFNHNSEYNIIKNNYITSNKENGVFLNSSSHNQLRNNSITKNVNGISLKYSSYCEIKNNYVDYNDYGLFLHYTLNTYILNNSFSYNDFYGACLDHSTKNYIRYNSFVNNKKIGLYLNQNSNYNVIEYNSFIDQIVHSFFEDTYTNTWSYNFWDDWDKIGFYPIYGRIHLVNGFISLTWLNFDFHPSGIKILSCK